jgi:hypothetical protein
MNESDQRWRVISPVTVNIPAPANLVLPQPTAAPKAENEELRDRFAMAALSGLLAARGDYDARAGAEFAQSAYRLADAMLVARENGGGQ